MSDIANGHAWCRGLICYHGTMGWQVYIIQCTDGSLYTGITTDLARRYAQHGGRRGARYFRGRAPRRLVYLEGGHDRSTASRRESAIKKLSRAGKLRLIKSVRNEISGYQVLSAACPAPVTDSTA